MAIIRDYAIAFVLLVSTSAVSADAQQQLDAYIDGTGLGALDPSDQTAIFSYLPRLTLLFELGDETIQVRQQTAPQNMRPYRRAITHDGIEVLVLDDGVSINRKVENLKKYKFLVNRLMPICRRPEDCGKINLWENFKSGLRRGPGWYTVEASQGGKFPEDADEPTHVKGDNTIWAIQLHDNVSGWVKRYVQSPRGPHNIEELGYITRLDRRHPLFRVYRESSETLLARIVAKNPSAPVTLLRTLIRSEDEATRRCVVLNRRAPYDVLSDLENQFPELFVNNPALELYNSFKILCPGIFYHRNTTCCGCVR